MLGVTRWDRVRNDEVWRMAGIEETLAEKVDRREERWIEHIERMDD